MVRIALFALALVAAAPLSAQAGGATRSVPRAKVVANAEAEFARVDANKDGQMSRVEIETFQRTSATAKLTARNKAMFAELDSDKSGQISAAEFAKATPTPKVDASEVLRVRFPGASIGYYEQEDRLWKARVWSDDVSPEIAALVSAGLSLETPMFAQMVHTRQPVFTDAWDSEREGVALTEEYGAVATYPLTVNGELHSLLAAPIWL